MITSEKTKVILKHQKAPPVDVLAIAKDLGVKVYETEKGTWPKSVSGLIKRSDSDKDRFEIIVNGDHSFTRQRFTVAHELAHFVLHDREIGDGIKDDFLFRSGLNNRIEKEANNFAADILMPWDLVDQQISAGETDIKKLADIFRVSPSTMSIRLGVPDD